jgi:uncharacterized protein YutE (UPF0331/DUF86 family)
MDLLDCLDQRVATLRAEGSVVKTEAVREKMERAASWLNDVELVLSRLPKEISEDTQEWDLASFRLFLAIQECIDLSAHWIACSAWKCPTDAPSAFDLLADLKAIDRDLAIRLREVVSLRDRISHGDFVEDRESLQGEYLQAVASLRRFLAAVADEAGL